MTHRRSKRSTGVAWVVGGLSALVLALLAASPAQSITNRNAREPLPNVDARTGTIAPTAQQRQIVQNLGASVIWNRFGTPESLIKYGGLLASGLTGPPVEAARGWIRANRTLFRLSDAEVSGLEVLNQSPLVGTTGQAVIFRQRFGSLRAGSGGLITVGVNQGRIFYVSSTAAGNQGVPAPATLTAFDAWLSAAQSIGRTVSVADIGPSRQDRGWTVFPVKDFETPMMTGIKAHGAMDQRARLVAVPTPGGARAAWHVTLVDLGAEEQGYEAFVDARTGDVLLRYNRLLHASEARKAPRATRKTAAPMNGTFAGATPAVGQCPAPTLHPIPVDAANGTIDVAATANVAVNDIVLNLLDPSLNVVASMDTGTSPEALHFALAPGHPTGNWFAQVCEFEEVASFTYTGVWQTTDVQQPALLNQKPAWRAFGINPLLGDLTPPFDYDDADTRLSACYIPGAPVAPPCDPRMTAVPSGVKEVGSPWDHNVQSNTPTFTTAGNNAITADTWLVPQPLGIGGPGPAQQRPLDLDRTYGFADSSQSLRPETWTNQWNNNRCDPAVLATPQGNDVMASITHLFASHNRHHDWTYRLGFTEKNFNGQVNNYGRGGMERDPEVGNAQAGALIGIAPGLIGGRDNANQLTLPDGLPGVTNQYLFQPVLGFWAPCVDGDLDVAIVGHEYSHFVTNRMVGGPDDGLDTDQGGAMGESWADQNGLEYAHQYGLLPLSGQGDWAAGAYATGNTETAIRNYALDQNALNFGDYGYDYIGPEIHSDGEIWSAVNLDIRKALVQKYNASFPESNDALQLECANGIRPAYLCPGNRRWTQIMYDAFLLMPSTVGMLGARDAYLAADVNRNLSHGSTKWPSNQLELWRAFAQRGFGLSASSPGGPNDTDPLPAYDSPEEAERAITFDLRGPGNVVVPGKVFVGHYEARATPSADTIGATALGPTVNFVPKTYQLLVQADGYGHRRVNLNVTAGAATTVTIQLQTNWASTTNGATATSAFGPATTGGLIDDTESTVWTAANVGDATNVAQPSVTVELGGGPKTVRVVRVSAMVTPDQSGLSAVRRFQLQVCDATAPTASGVRSTLAAKGVLACTLPADYTTVYTSPANTAPGCPVTSSNCGVLTVPFDAKHPFVAAPPLLIRRIDIPTASEVAATHVRLIVLDNQCTGTPEYQGDQDNDPSTFTDCDGDPPGGLPLSLVSAAFDDVTVAELQVFDSNTA